MSTVTLTVYTASRAATPAVAFTDNHTNATAGNSYEFPNDEKTILICADTGGAGGTLTLDIPTTVDGLAVTDKPITLPASKTVAVGPFPKSVYSSTVAVSVSANTDVMAVSIG